MCIPYVVPGQLQVEAWVENRVKENVLHFS